MKDVILFGAGTIGRLIARELTAKGNPPLMFADNDSSKWHTSIEGVMVRSPEYSRTEFPGATWVATVLRTPFPAEIASQLRSMGVRVEPLINYLAAKQAPLDSEAIRKVFPLCADDDSREELIDQYRFRSDGLEHVQRPYDDIKDVYFPDFITKLHNEVFVDCGAADGDTVIEVLRRWPVNGKLSILSIEPDPKNYRALQEKRFSCSVVTPVMAAISDFDGSMSFTATGDQTAHLGGVGDEVPVVKLDTLLQGISPTFIKMDIEGAELEALWGARKTIRSNSPVLAICAYHEGDHLWQIPLLIHAINPHYKLYLRRYLEMSWELIWYAVPQEREC